MKKLSPKCIHTCLCESNFFSCSSSSRYVSESHWLSFWRFFSFHRQVSLFSFIVHVNSVHYKYYSTWFFFGEEKNLNFTFSQWPSYTVKQVWVSSSCLNYSGAYKVTIRLLKLSVEIIPHRKLNWRRCQSNTILQLLQLFFAQRGQFFSLRLLLVYIIILM